MNEHDMVEDTEQEEVSELDYRRRVSCQSDAHGISK